MNPKNNELNRENLKIVLGKLKSVKTLDELNEYCDFSVENLFNGLSNHTVQSTTLSVLPDNITFEDAKKQRINELTKLIDELEKNKEFKTEEE
ncbi:MULTISPECIES: hypothetical protein [unclassified Sphingobacterium]|uniref:hypothetical protein n=1 Tax=unclassified Sphingobacterium TaxID=2609468 RepID=UPI0020C20046|nr:MULTISPECIES: hypothetical protein [unclassified Sphingobacterium]